LSLLASIRKGFRFFLMGMGVSTYPRKSPPLPEAQKPAGSSPVKPE
jgi:hypothetical protein